jgi:hypothetical protein
VTLNNGVARHNCSKNKKTLLWPEKAQSLIDLVCFTSISDAEKVYYYYYYYYTLKNKYNCMHLYGKSRSVQFTCRFPTEHAGNTRIILLDAAQSKELFATQNCVFFACFSLCRNKKKTIYFAI